MVIVTTVIAPILLNRILQKVPLSFLININSSGPINITSWTNNKKIKLQIKDYNLSYENKSYLHGSFGWENETPRILFVKPKIKIKCIGRKSDQNNINNISDNNSDKNHIITISDETIINNTLDKSIGIPAKYLSIN